MTMETGTATDLEDLLAKLNTFATTTHGGWTSGYTGLNTTNGWFELSKGSLSASFKWPVGAQGPPENMSIHQATAFVNASTAPGQHTNDSGNGYNTTDTGHTNANLLTERCVSQIGNGPFPSYAFFADVNATTGADYIHVVVEVTSGVFRHFGFGLMEKRGDGWTGGEYAYGCYVDQAINAEPVDSNHECFFSGLGTTAAEQPRCATIRIDGNLLNNSSPTSTWGVSLSSSTTGNDTGGTTRRQIHGGWRAGMEIRGLGDIVGNSSSGVVLASSIPAYYRDPTSPPRRVQLLGYLPDVRQVNIRNFEPGQQVTFGVDTWTLYPWSSRAVANTANRSEYMGVAYLNV